MPIAVAAEYAPGTLLAWVPAIFVSGKRQRHLIGTVPLKRAASAAMICAPSAGLTPDAAKLAASSPLIPRVVQGARSRPVALVESAARVCQASATRKSANRRNILGGHVSQSCWFTMLGDTEGRGSRVRQAGKQSALLIL
jgi:hypothetical protein